MAGQRDNFKPKAQPTKGLTLDEKGGKNENFFLESGYDTEPTGELGNLIEELTRMKTESRDHGLNTDSGINREYPEENRRYPEEMMASMMHKVAKANEMTDAKLKSTKSPGRDDRRGDKPYTPYSDRHREWREEPMDRRRDEREYLREQRTDGRRYQSYKEEDRRREAPRDNYRDDERSRDESRYYDREARHFYREPRRERSDERYSPKVRHEDPYRTEGPGYYKPRDKFSDSSDYDKSKRQSTLPKSSLEMPESLAGHPLGEQLKKKREMDSKQEDEQILAEAEEIHKCLRDGTFGKHLNILLVGNTGVGKSSLINSLLMALNEGGYKELARMGFFGLGGRGGRAAVTLSIIAHKLFTTKFFPKGSPEHKYACQPMIYDCPGFLDSDDSNITTILRKIILGQVPDDTNVKALMKMTKPELKKWGNKPNKSKQVDAVIVVHAATDTIAEELLNAVRDAAQPDEQGAANVPLFGVITKLDLLKDPKRDVMVIEDALAEHLGVAGSANKIFCTSLYNKEVTPKMKRNREIDTVMCELMITILQSIYTGHDKPGLFTKIFK